MAKKLDLEEQEQLDQFKYFWKQYGDWISWALIAVLAVFAAVNVYQYWQRKQAAQAAVLYDSVDKAIKSKDVPALARTVADMKEHFAKTSLTAQASLLAAKTFYEQGNVPQAQEALSWVVDHAADKNYQAIARLRLAGMLFEAKNYDLALAQLKEPMAEYFEPLAADRRGDILLAQGKSPEAQAAYEKAYQGLSDRSQYRQLVQAKLSALGVDPASVSLVKVKP